MQRPLKITVAIVALLASASIGSVVSQAIEGGDAIPNPPIINIAPTPVELDPDGDTTICADDREVDCKLAKSVQEQLIASGALKANVKVERDPAVYAQVFLPKESKSSWDAQAAAEAIAKAVKTKPTSVTITDGSLAMLHPAPPELPGSPAEVTTITG